MQFIALAASFIGYGVLIVLALLVFVLGVLFIMDTVRFSGFRRGKPSKSFLPLLFIPYVDGVAQFIGYCILIPFALALLVVGIFYAVLAIKEMRTNRLLKAERARVVQLHKELQLDKVATSDLITTLLHLQETAKNTPSSDPSFLDLRDRIEATQNELARRPWGTR